MTVNAKRQNERDNEHADNSPAFSVTKPVRLDQLSEELSSEGVEHKGLMAEGDVSAASTENPVTVWVLGDVDVKDFRKVVNAHKPEKEKNVLAELKAKVADGNDLSDEDVREAIKALILRAVV